MLPLSIPGNRKDACHPTHVKAVPNTTSSNDLAGPPNACASSNLGVEDTISGSIGSNTEASIYSRAPALPTTGSTYLSCTSTPTTFAPTIFTNQPVNRKHPRISANISKPAPIRIPSPTITVCDVNRVPTPGSGRGDRKGHLSPTSQGPSPSRLITRHPSKSKTCSASDGEEPSSLLGQVRSASLASTTSGKSPRVGERINMHGESMAPRYPTSPLSPRPQAQQGLSSQNAQRRGNHGRQSSRNMQLNLGRFHPSNFAQADSTQPGVSAMPAPQITYSRAPAPVPVESPRLLREKHREFLEKARLSSKLAASSFSAKPDAPRLDPLGSPKGPVTPLELEGAADYFSVAGAGKVSPAGSPGTRSPRALSVSSDDDTKPPKSRKVAAT